MAEWTTDMETDGGKSLREEVFEKARRDRAKWRVQRLLESQYRKNSLGLWALAVCMNAVSILILVRGVLR